MSTPWHQILKTGYAPIDEEHAALLTRLEDVLAATNGGKLIDLGASLACLVEEVGRHFRHEEELMAVHGFAQARRHKEAHDLFLLDAGRHLTEFREAGLTDGLRRWVVGRMLEWFRFHVSANDAGLAQFLLTRPRDEAHVQPKADPPAAS